MMNEIHVGDVGTVLEMTIKDGTAVVDISGATLKEIWLQDPNGTTVKHDGEFVTDGSDGKIRYTTVSGDLTYRGRWKIQGCVSLPDGTWHSNISEFEVFGNL